MKFDPYRYYLNKEKIPWTKPFWIIFGMVTITIILWLLSFFWLYQNFTQNSFLKLFWYICLIWFCGGAFIFVVKYTEQWDESLIDIQNGIYFKSRFHNRATFKLVFPKNDQSTNQSEDRKIEIDYTAFFNSLNHSLKTANATKENDLNMGKKPLSLFFDFVAENGTLNTYLTVSGSKVRGITDAMTRHCPHIKLEEVEDPIKHLFAEYKSKELNLDNISGFSLGFNQSNLYPVGPAPHQSHKQQSIQNLLKYLKDFSKNKTIILQYGFLFSDGEPQQAYQKEFDQFMLNFTNQYNADFGTGQRSVKKLFPETAVQRYNGIYKRLSSTWFMTAMRTLCYDKSGEDNQKQMERAFNSFIEGTKIPMSINYLTSTKQTYYRYDKTNRQPEADEIFDVYVYPPKGDLETFVAPWYEKLYYPQEGKLRRGTILRSICIRNPMQPWHPKFTWMDTQSVKYYFCLEDI
jgi:hypothetical protein